MGRYSKEVSNETKAVKARGSHLRIHYKHCREIAHAINGMKLTKAKSYLENVLVYKEAIPFTKYTGGIGRHAVGKQYKAPGDKVSWPQKATKSFIDLLRNIESNTQTKGLDVDKVVITHAQANQAPKMRRRTYRAHGRVNAYMSCPAHIEIIAEEKNEEIVKEAEAAGARVTRKQLLQSRGRTKHIAIKTGGGVN